MGETRRVRILVLTNMYPPHAYGGYEQSCQDVVERWRSKGHEVLVLTSDIRVPEVPEPPSGERGSVRRELRLYWDDHKILNPPLRRRLSWERSNRRSLMRAIADLRPDVVSAWAMGAMSLGLLGSVRRRGIPVVSVICDEWPVYGPLVDAWLRPLSRRPSWARLVHMATGLPTEPPELDEIGPSCFVSEFLRSAVRERSIWQFPDSGVVYSGIATDDFVVSKVEGEWRWKLLYVGRIDPRKGIDLAVRALAECPAEATLKVIGRGDEKYMGELTTLVGQLGVSDRIEFLVCPRRELARQYAEADVLVFPSVWEEPFGLVPIEAMACGTPVVGAPVGGSAEFLFDGENCVTFEPGAKTSLLESLRRLASDAELRRSLVAGGYRTAKELGVDRLAEVLEHWHESAIAGRGAARPGDRVIEPSTVPHDAPGPRASRDAVRG